MLFSLFEAELKKAAEDIRSKTKNESVLFTVGDLTKAEDIESVVKNTVSEWGTVDVLVNNTGGPPAGKFMDFEDDDWVNAYELVLLSFIRSIRAVLPYMMEQGGGRIVNSTSSSVKSVIDNLILSNTFRMGVIGLMKTLSQE